MIALCTSCGSATKTETTIAATHFENLEPVKQENLPCKDQKIEVVEATIKRRQRGDRGAKAKESPIKS